MATPSVLTRNPLTKLLQRLRNPEKRASTTPHHLVARKVQYDWQQTPRDWIYGEPFSSHLINTMHLILPDGEFWMCRMLNKALPLVTDPKLREDIQLFIRQEAMHARSHIGAADIHLREHGLYPEAFMEHVRWVIGQLDSETPFGLPLPKSQEKNWLLFRLGFMAALEHLTCVLGVYALEQKSWEINGADPVLLDLIRWHGAEEVEHRAVVFDTFRHVGGGYADRFLPAALMIFMVAGYWSYGSTRILRLHPEMPANFSLLHPRFLKEWFKARQKGLLPGIGWLSYQMLGFFKPGYEPIEEASTEQALAYLAVSPGYLATQEPKLPIPASA